MPIPDNSIISGPYASTRSLYSLTEVSLFDLPFEVPIVETNIDSTPLADSALDKVPVTDPVEVNNSITPVIAIIDPPEEVVVDPPEEVVVDPPEEAVIDPPEEVVDPPEEVVIDPPEEVVIDPLVIPLVTMAKNHVVKIDFFGGKKDKAVVWLRSYENKARLTEAPASFYDDISQYMSGAAADWHFGLPDTQKDNFANWKKAFKGRFGYKAFESNSKLGQLAGSVQLPQETCAEFAERMRLACEGYEDISEVDKANLVMRGLHSSLRLALEIQGVKTILDIMDSSVSHNMPPSSGPIVSDIMVNKVLPQNDQTTIIANLLQSQTAMAEHMKQLSQAMDSLRTTTSVRLASAQDFSRPPPNHNQTASLPNTPRKGRGRKEMDMSKPLCFECGDRYCDGEKNCDYIIHQIKCKYCHREGHREKSGRCFHMNRGTGYQ